jgi:hypothetical protein
VLRELDVEGFLALGAPDDEYDSEARVIAERASKLRSITVEEAAEIVATVWNEYFGPFAAADLEMRRAAIAEAARRIVSA